MKTSFLFPGLLVLLLVGGLHAATFNGSSRVTAGDSTGALAGNPANNQLTVSCWFKMSIPSTVTLSKDMVIVTNSQDSTPGGAHAFQILFSITTGNVEFRAKGAGGTLAPQILIARPYLERWQWIIFAISHLPRTNPRMITRGRAPFTPPAPSSAAASAASPQDRLRRTQGLCG